jgi:type IV pilus assembly protein PilA
MSGTTDEEQMRMPGQRGFTLIELMIVVAIVGTLAAIAMPAYQDYVVRSKVTEALGQVAACKTAVTEYVQTNSAFPASEAAAGCSTLSPTFAKAPTVNAGVITIELQNILAGDPDGKTLVLTPDGPPVTKWTCTTTASKKYVPSICR